MPTEVDGTERTATPMPSALRVAHVTRAVTLLIAGFAITFSATMHGNADFDRWLLLASLVLIGLATAVEYAKIREQFGRTIGSFQSIKHLAADMLCRTEQVRALAWDAAVAAEDLGEDGSELPVAAAVAMTAPL